MLNRSSRLLLTGVLASLAAAPAADAATARFAATFKGTGTRPMLGPARGRVAGTRPRRPTPASCSAAAAP